MIHHQTRVTLMLQGRYVLTEICLCYANAQESICSVQCRSMSLYHIMLNILLIELVNPLFTPQPLSVHYHLYWFVNISPCKYLHIPIVGSWRVVSRITGSQSRGLSDLSPDCSAMLQRSRLQLVWRNTTSD